MKKFFRSLSVFLIIGIMGFSLGACANKEQGKENKTAVNKEVASDKKEETKDQPTSENENKEDKTKSEEKKTVKLYFADENVMYLVEEEREIADFSANTVVQELLKGPSTKGFNRTLDENIKVKSVEVKDEIAYVDFDENVKGKIAGSTGETMALYSISNSLILNKDLGVKAVEFRVEGKKVESLGGHIILDKPVKENLELIKK
ncbi:GerMN domain-containing protein [Hathewaya massiliensis]|uniref:GerMN domain-containing protein n=1 Tax=Hathewaya massiliensis TaxID=1964382 RepID=UPI00115BBCC7|nr:GerMN domain-containing protein [Hathewaya massiliensis]